MISIKEKTHCCGCNACVQVCPRSCINRVVDEEGFSYPKVDTELCIKCDLCEKVCPYHNNISSVRPISVFSAVNEEESIRMESSSGGAFSALAKMVLKDKGRVYGAAFNSDWEVHHIGICDEKDLYRLRGSKYVQSEIGSIYKEIKDYLDSGLTILFSGTPCQVKGLKLFLIKNYNNLITIEVVCHGVPSPKVWKVFLNEINTENKEITSIQMRNKSRGWSSYSVEIKSEDESLFSDYARNCLYINGFIQNYSIRPSCFNCPAKAGSSGADITLADFWGIQTKEPLFCDNKGVSAILINTERGKRMVSSCDLFLKESSIDAFVKENKSYLESAKANPNRLKFWELFPEQGLSAIKTIKESCHPSLFRKGLQLIKRLLR